MSTRRKKKSEVPAVAPTYSQIKSEIMLKVIEFRNEMVEKYKDYHGHDMRKEIAWYLEQYGISVDRELESEKRILREKSILASSRQEP